MLLEKISYFSSIMYGSSFSYQFLCRLYDSWFRQRHFIFILNVSETSAVFFYIDYTVQYIQLINMEPFRLQFNFTVHSSSIFRLQWFLFTFRTGFMGHLCGALAGLLVGVFILDNRCIQRLLQMSSLLCKSFILNFKSCLYHLPTLQKPGSLQFALDSLFCCSTIL